MLFFWRMAIAGQMPSIAVDVGLLHPLEELAGVGRQRLDVAPLPLGVDRVEGERRLARAADAGDDDELAGRHRHVDVLEVVRACAADDDVADARSGGICHDQVMEAVQGRCRKRASYPMPSDASNHDRRTSRRRCRPRLSTMWPPAGVFVIQFARRDHGAGDLSMTTEAAPATSPGSAAPSGPEWADWPDERLLDLRFCDLKLTDRGQLARGAHRGSSTRNSARRASASSRTSGCRTSGSRRTA